MTDKVDTIALDGVGYHARWLSYDARQLGHYVQMLTHQRPFETESMAAVEDAEKALKEVLETITEAKTRYQSLRMWKPGESS